MIAFIIGAILGSALIIVVGVLLAGYHLWRRRGDEVEWKRQWSAGLSGVQVINTTGLPDGYDPPSAALIQPSSTELVYLHNGVWITPKEGCIECGDPIEDGECPHGRPLCDTHRLAWCYRCGTDLEADRQDAIFDGVRDVARDREERS